MVSGTRDDGPAIEWAHGDKQWYQSGQLHRDNGPAVEWVDGTKAWWLNGNNLSEEDFNDLQRGVVSKC